MWRESDTWWNAKHCWVSNLNQGSGIRKLSWSLQSLQADSYCLWQHKLKCPWRLHMVSSYDILLVVCSYYQAVAGSSIYKVGIMVNFRLWYWLHCEKIVKKVLASCMAVWKSMLNPDLCSMQQIPNVSPTSISMQYNTKWIQGIRRSSVIIKSRVCGVKQGAWLRGMTSCPGNQSGNYDRHTLSLTELAS